MRTELEEGELDPRLRQLILWALEDEDPPETLEDQQSWANFYGMSLVDYQAWRSHPLSPDERVVRMIEIMRENEKDDQD